MLALDEAIEENTLTATTTPTTFTANQTKAEKRTRLYKTALINITFLGCLGVPAGAFGPALLDLADVYDVDIDVMSYIWLFASAGSLLGAISST